MQCSVHEGLTDCWGQWQGHKLGWCPEKVVKLSLGLRRGPRGGREELSGRRCSVSEGMRHEREVPGWVQGGRKQGEPLGGHQGPG